MKIFRKTATAAILIILALFLATCVPEPPESGGGGGNDEYTGVEYEFVGTGDNIRVKSVKLYLDGYKVPKSPQQRAMEQRALTLEGARMSHNFFEVVFMASGTGPVARATWEIGQPAGISGVSRASVDYRPVTGANAKSIIFVGKKASKTLLGVGYLSHVDDEAATGTNVVIDGTTSVTFTVSPLRTWLGFDDPDEVSTKSYETDPVDGVEMGFATFITATGAGGPPYTGATEGFTEGNDYNVAGFTGVSFPFYKLPNVASGTATVQAYYEVGGLRVPSIAATPTPISSGVFVWGQLDGIGTITANANNTTTVGMKGGIEFIKRTPTFAYGTLTYEIRDGKFDKATSVTTIGQAASTAFASKMEITFNMNVNSNGLFSITFQVPVYALSLERASNDDNNLQPEKWWIRPDYDQYQYLLDDGLNTGGAVLVGNVSTSSAVGEWLQIKTTGIGFSNE